VISSYNFNLYQVAAGVLTLVSSSSVADTAVTFDIAAAGFYFVTVDLTVITIDSTSRYPLGLTFSFYDNICPSGEYF
jgi:hypothetical protein